MARRSKAASVSALQPDLFSFAAAFSQAPVAMQLPERATVGKVVEIGRSLKAIATTPSVEKPIAKPQTSERAVAETRVVSLDDLPDYPLLDQELVDRSIAALPANRIWFTYAAIKECFGVSRATVARKVKKGLVPGIRFRGTNVLEDGPVRRFDRSQLRWLLLSVRSHK